MRKPEYFDAMSYINSAVRMFLEEEPEDALVVLQSAQRHYFDMLQYERFMEEVASMSDDEGTADA